MWLNWLPWKYMVRYAARKQGFIDPIGLFARLEAFAQPSETMAPVELLRAGAVLHARGFINSHVIQHNLDWVWPFWVERQFNPNHPAFIPRAFSMTHINLTQRNWTAAGHPGCPEFPVVDGRGLVMPFFDSWSLDAWFIPDAGEILVPSRREKNVAQTLELSPNLRIRTETSSGEGERVSACVETLSEEGTSLCRLNLRMESMKSGWLAASLRPYNPEGVSFVNEISLLSGDSGWKINGEHTVRFSRPPDEHLMSCYRDGDVYLAAKKREFNRKAHVLCEVGMATAAVLYRVAAGTRTEVSLDIPLAIAGAADSAALSWSEALKQSSKFSGGPGRFRFLYEAALRTTLLLSPREVFAGPYTYRRFWYRDAAIIVHAMMCTGHQGAAEKILDFCVSRQSGSGYFKSQEGEWDSNGQVLWALGRYCRLFHAVPKPGWVPAIRKAVHWIRRKRLGEKARKRHSHLMPAGFSAEHLGPNDYYYWDDFWTLSGLRFAAEMLKRAGDLEAASEAWKEAEQLSEAVDRSLSLTAGITGSQAMPASPYRRMDSGSVGSLAVGFPLQLWPASDPRLLETVEFLCRHCLIDDAFFHDISHSGINPYLTLHIAQCLLRAGDPRFRNLMRSIADLASDTGQWPEAIHPRLRTGCMGDGQHAWAAAEWMLLTRNCFVFEEEFQDKLILAAGLDPDWCSDGGRTEFGSAPTRFGSISVSLELRGDKMELCWSADWHGSEPEIEARFGTEEWEVLEAGPGRRLYGKRSTP